MLGIQAGGGLEEQAILRHRVGDPGAGEDEAVIAAERRDHHGQRHDGGARRSEGGLRHGGGHAIFRRELYAAPDHIGSGRVPGQRQDREIRQVHEHIQQDHEPGSERQRARKVPLRVLHLTADKRDVVPCVGREQRSDHGDPDDRQSRSPISLPGIGQPRIERLPQGGEIGLERRRIGKQDAEENDSGEDADLRVGEQVLHERAERDASKIHPCEQRDGENRQQILGVQADVVRPELSKPERKGSERAQFEDPGRRGEPGEQHAGEFGEGDRHRRDRRRLNHEQHRPAVQESPQWPEHLANVDILPAGVRHGGGELAVVQSGHHCHKAGDQPYRQQQPRAIDLPRNVRRDDEDAGADHRADHDHRGVGEP